MTQAEVVPIGMSAADRTRRLCFAGVIALVVAGEVCRLAQYASTQSFWGDEVAVLTNTRAHPAGELPFVRLEAWGKDSPVAAPPLFLWATQWMGEHFHYQEWAVRLLPLLCSMAAVPLVAALAWRVGTPVAAVWATALFSLSDALLFQAANTKPYSGDVFVAALIAWTALVPGGSAARRLAWAGAITALGCWLSYAAVFSLAAAGFALWAQLHRDRKIGLLRMALCVAPAVASFLAVYLLCIRAQRDAELDVYWVHMFPNFSRPWSVPYWLIGSTWQIFYIQMYPIGQIMVVAAAAGAWKLRRSGNLTLLILLTAPIGLDLLAACIAQYPYGGTRLTLFLAPSLCILTGIGVAAMSELFARRGRTVQFVLAAVPLTMVAVAGYHFVHPRNNGNMRDAVRFLQAHRSKDDQVYLVGDQALGTADWYLPTPDPNTHRHLERSAPIRANRFWLVISYAPKQRSENTEVFTQPDAQIDESRSFHTDGADVLYFVPK